MYFVDRNKIDVILTYMDELLVLLEEQTFSTTVENLARERIIHVLIESTLDVGNMMIDGFIMRDPGSYEDIIDILIDEKVLPEEEEENYKAFIELRKIIVAEYVNVDQKQIINTTAKSTAVLKNFSTHIRNYLKNELGVANAFLNE